MPGSARNVISGYGYTLILDKLQELFLYFWVNEYRDFFNNLLNTPSILGLQNKKWRRTRNARRPVSQEEKTFRSFYGKDTKP
jgi:hypothetical protein